ncbi:hypothetical protein Q1695_012197 [Nippostrongylus brasiliensis]|nr:hypothetical protein Q1695_012197 [Nippostrongylus brasiliensis]
MAQLFNVACSALAALNTLNDDKRTHNLTATVPSLQAFPVRFDFTIPNMTSECGWTSQRPVYLWIVGAETLCRASIQRAHFSFEERALHVRAIAPAYDHRGTMAAITRLGIISGNSATVDIFVKLGRVPSGADPVYEIIASSQLFESADFSGDSRGLQVLDMVYAQSRRGCRSDGLLQYSTTFSVGGSQITLRPEQMEAIRLSDDRFPVVGIQAAFGTGKTVVGAIIAAHSASKPRGGSVVATSTTNTAVAQFVDTLSKLDDYRDVVILRYVSDTALREGAPQTPFDMHTVLKRLHIDFADQLSQGEIELCEQFARGRELLERSLFNPDATLHLTERQREECRIAEKELPKMTTTVVALMFRVRRPSVICLTTAALLNSADKDGLFRTELPQYKTIIGDEASQIPEPAFVAMTTRLCSARHVYIGDVHQLEPHAAASHVKHSREMFRKPFQVKKNNNLRNSDVRKLIHRLPPALSDLLPKKALVAHVKVVTFNGATLNVYTVDKEPMFFDFDAEGVLFPTVYCTGHALSSFPLLLTHEAVLPHLENGADLMLPGVIRKELPMPQFNRGDVVVIAVSSGDQVIGPMAIGAALMSSQEMVANKFEGRGVQVLHVFRDFLWEFGSRVNPATVAMNILLNTEKEVHNEDEPLALHSVSEILCDIDSNSKTPEESADQTSPEEAGDGTVNEVVEDDEPMDHLLYRCFLAALKYRLDKVPIDVGQFYSHYLLKCVPENKRLDMKKTKYKKFSVFLEEVNKGEDGLFIQVQKVGKGCDAISEVFKSHPAVRSFVATDEIIKDEEETCAKLGPKIYEYFSITEGVLPLLKTRGRFSKGQLMEGPEIRELITDYVKSEELSQGKLVRLDPILAQVTKIPNETTDWNTLIQKVQSKMTKTFVLRMPDGRELVRKVETRSGNKKVTLINNLCVFGIEIKKLCHRIQVEAATSATTTNEAVNCEGPQVTVLGNQVNYLGDLLMNEYGIDKKHIDGLDLGIKKKRK